MGLSGVLAGGTLMGVCGLISGLFATFSPMWLITRLELHNKLCWRGTGLWQSDFVWGQDIPEMDLICDGTPRSTYGLYCNAEVGHDFERSMCTPTNLAKVSMLMAQLMGIFALFSAHHFATKRYKVDSNNYSDELYLSKILLSLSVVTAGFGTFGFLVVYTSQMFSAEHAREISKAGTVPFTSAQFGCTFQSPLRAAHPLQALITSSPLNCLYGGPSFAMAVTSFVCWTLASFFHFLLFRDVRRLQQALDADASVRVTPKPPIRHPLLTEVLYPRTYSLYGAISRKFSHSKWRKSILLILPFITMAMAGMFAVMMLMNGAAVQVFIRLSSPAFTRDEWEHALRDHPAHRAIFSSDANSNAAKQSAVIEIIEEVFDFTMLTSIKNFWDGKAYALALLTAVFCAVWPFIRVVVHLCMYFIPFPEQHRGRTLTWIDSLGKWTLVNTFVLCFMGVAFHLQSLIRLRGLFPTSRDILDVGVEVSLGPRVATYLFVFGGLLSIVVAESYVILHRKCRDWEEERNAESLAAEVEGTDDGGVQQQFAGAVSPSLARGISTDDQERLNELREASSSGSAGAGKRKVRYQHGFGYEALCDRHHSPLPGKGRYVYSRLAKFLVWVCLGLTGSTTLAGMLQVSMAFTFEGLVGDLIVDAHNRRREYSLMSIGTSIETDVGSVPLGGVFLTGVFFVIAFAAPLLRICGISVLWFVPMRPKQQKSWFHLLEVLESWSALDVYFVSTLAATLEIGKLSTVILGGSFPAVEALVNKAFPQFGGLFVVQEELLNGMYLIFVGVVSEKFMSLFIVAQTANAVAERTAEERLALGRNRGLPGVREENDMFRELEEHPETWAILSPAARYTSASANTSMVYSGLPHFVWMAGIKLGMMVEADDDVADVRESMSREASYFSLEAV